MHVYTSLLYCIRLIQASRKSVLNKRSIERLILKRYAGLPTSLYVSGLPWQFPGYSSSCALRPLTFFVPLCAATSYIYKCHTQYTYNILNMCLYIKYILCITFISIVVERGIYLEIV